jgi:hypothetical protein
MAARNGGVAAAAAAIPVESNSRREMGMNMDRLPTSFAHILPDRGPVVVGRPDGSFRLIKEHETRLRAVLSNCISRV